MVVQAMRQHNHQRYLHKHQLHTPVHVCKRLWKIRSFNQYPPSENHSYVPVDKLANRPRPKGNIQRVQHYRVENTVYFG